MSGVPYHAWTHLPKAEGGTDPIASFGLASLLAVRTTDLIVADDNESALLTFDTWTNSDTSIFHETLSGGLLQKVAFLLAGVYSINVGHIWTTEFFEAHGILILDDSVATTDWIDTGNMGFFHGNTGNQFIYPPTAGVTRAYPLEPTATGYSAGQGGMGRVSFKANQSSGVNRTLEAAWVNIFYLGELATSSP